MVRTTIDVTPDTRLEPEPMAVNYGGGRAVGLVHIRDGNGSGLVMGAPAELRALAAVVISAAEQAEEMIRVVELLGAAGMMEAKAA